jgi:phosphoribosyl-AMP cyclohydrolase
MQTARLTHAQDGKGSSWMRQAHNTAAATGMDLAQSITTFLSRKQIWTKGESTWQTTNQIRIQDINSRILASKCLPFSRSKSLRRQFRTRNN